MLRTFDENLVITAVQQLTTDLDSLSGRIKKLEEGGGGPKLIIEKTYENIEITNTTEQTFDTITLGDDFLLAKDEMIVILTKFDNNEAGKKILTERCYYTNFAGALSGNKLPLTNELINLDLSVELVNTGSVGIYGSTLSLTNNTVLMKARYNASYGYVGGTVTMQIFKTKITA